ncbi:FkbM family methyltransferase [Natronobacterium gregoryi]|uniref:FkbM family methyltransferase n=2 Tax=Natronobacterium gregoryi TaxID=44930 RepID=L0AGD1_NATGS|nr:FkbM family methyltransferase [Natronobacterium gregoryi]AFZ72978.1 methyltransferase, FkbM family [Natronobacterium gregoryi SP2]ELY69874.1 FkbM family methyltransferase [Natronobacterium gregoryi SP2]PLK21938.1 FkbM family methyltransferase [Natronobacterium gregoryi SP2]SFI68943.1 methyltransferase, FkbM family [Natronobacterium gregoryi]
MVPATLEDARGFVHIVYHRLRELNYDYLRRSRRNRTPAGAFRCYEPVNRHGSDEMLAELDDACGPSAVVFDVGANVGVYALALTSDEPDRRVVAFEPASRSAKRLRANVRLNGLGARIDVQVCGVGDENAERPFFRSSNPELSAFDGASARRWGASVAEIRSSPVRRLDSLVLENNLPSPDAIKIDAEGAAPAVLTGARDVIERYRPTLLIEIHEDGFKRDITGESRATLEAHDYAIDERDGFWRCEPSQEREE